MRTVNDSWARRAVAGIWLLALAASLLVVGTMVSARQRVTHVADALVRGEAEGVLRAVDDDLERPVDPASMGRTLERFRPAGLRYLAFVEPFDDRVCEVGESALGDPRTPGEVPHDHPGFVRGEDRVRLVQPTFRMAGGGPPGRGSPCSD